MELSIAEKGKQTLNTIIWNWIQSPPISLPLFNEIRKKCRAAGYYETLVITTVANKSTICIVLLLSQRFWKAQRTEGQTNSHYLQRIMWISRPSVRCAMLSYTAGPNSNQSNRVTYLHKWGMQAYVYLPNTLLEAMGEG